MDQELKCIPVFSLKEMAMRMVVALSFSSPDVIEKISQVQLISRNQGENRREWRECVEDVVTDKMSKLGLPKSLMELAEDLVRPIGFELRRWILSHDYVRNPLVDKPLPGSTKLCWTSLGVIDDQKTARNLVHSDLISLERRYEMACQYCLEESICHLWVELPEEKKAHYSIGNLNCSHLAVVWPHILSGELSSVKHLLTKGDRILMSFNQWGFEYSVENPMSCSQFATKYFFEKLTIAEREDSLVRCANSLLGYRRNDPLLALARNNEPIPHVYYDKKYFKVLHYLLTMMSPEERRRTVKKHLLGVLVLFLYWPLQDLFVENASLIWTLPHFYSYYFLLERLIERFHDLGKHFPKLFQEFFIQSPPELKKVFANKCNPYLTETIIPATDFLKLFFHSEDSESIKVVFRNVGEADRLRIMFDQSFGELSLQSIMKGRWHMVEVCLQEVTLSEENKKKWKRLFMNFDRHLIEPGDQKFKGFFEFFGEDDEEKGQKRNFSELLDDHSLE